MNRISASKLWQLSLVLGVPVQWFFEEFSKKKTQQETFHMKRETLELVRNYSAIPADIQRHFLRLVKACS